MLSVNASHTFVVLQWIDLPLTFQNKSLMCFTDNIVKHGLDYYSAILKKPKYM